MSAGLSSIPTNVERAKYLFVRLFLRKPVWLRASSLENYFPLPDPEKGGPRPADLLEESLGELVAAAFLEDSSRSTLTLEEILEVIGLEELRQICSKEAWARNVKSVTLAPQPCLSSRKRDLRRSCSEIPPRSPASPLSRDGERAFPAGG